MKAHHLNLSGEPSLDETLRDPVIKLLMARDGISRGDIESLAAQRRREMPGAEESICAGENV
jgi:hypothetical protein